MTTFHPGGGGSSLTSADNSIPCHAELVSASHNKEIPKLVRDDKSHFPRPQGRGIKGEGLLHRPDCKILKRVQHDKNFASLCKVQLDKDNIPRPLWERKEFLNERSEFRNSGEGSFAIDNCKPLTRICSSLRSHNCSLSLKGRGKRYSKKAAFTLAEVLITLAIIGVVAAMTIPTLIANYQERAWNTSAKVFVRKLEEALKTMNTQQSLAGYSNTADFVAALGKHFKITRVCQNDDIMSCFEECL